MGLLTPNQLKSLESLYTIQLRYLLSTENQLLKGLKSMIEHASDQHLQQAFESHLQETDGHVSRLNQIIAEMNHGNVDDKKDPIITALIGSGDNIVSESEEGAIRDAGLVATAHKIGHYEIASYGSARDWAQILGLSSHADLLQQALNEEKHADELLTKIAQQLNQSAAVA